MLRRVLRIAKFVVRTVASSTSSKTAKLGDIPLLRSPQDDAAAGSPAQAVRHGQFEVVIRRLRYQPALLTGCFQQTPLDRPLGLCDLVQIVRSIPSCRRLDLPPAAAILQARYRTLAAADPRWRMGGFLAGLLGPECDYHQEQGSRRDRPNREPDEVGERPAFPEEDVGGGGGLPPRSCGLLDTWKSSRYCRWQPGLQ